LSRGGDGSLKVDDVGAIILERKFPFLKRTSIRLRILVCLEKNIFVCNGLISMYSKCGELRDSVTIFESMVQRNVMS